MRYLTLDIIKKQVVIDQDYDDDNLYLEHLGAAAEDYVEQLLNTNLDELVAENGQLPPSILHACLIVVDYLYSTERGSSGHDNQIPECVDNMIKLYRSFT